MKEQCLNKDFIRRTLHIIEHYDGPYGVTLLINCLLGLIVLPKEKDFNGINDSKLNFSALGMSEKEIVSWGQIDQAERTVSRFLRCLRNSVAHLQIESISSKGEIESLRFVDDSGFEAVFPLEKLKEILTRLALLVIAD